jgi:hypothetical protein
MSIGPRRRIGAQAVFKSTSGVGCREMLLRAACKGAYASDRSRASRTVPEALGWDGRALPCVIDTEG